ncbi:hypothetical protein C6P40_001680 [Pichia californica]|uniref:WLM domain-containing protein n=1 Tax=Pichia californica TaxID=460514 RepID=A0A9P6WP65_9ASCO|nr:hypothetical protein C6P40_001680 [[Candida] californica]
MHHYNFKIGLLCEMYPKDRCLLGLNVNRGQKICLRLRSPTDSKWFLERDEIVGTMLHELTHNWHGPHDAKFYKVLDELKDKYFEFQVSHSMKNSSYPNNFSADILKKPKNIVKKYTTRVSKLGSESKNINLQLNLSLRELMRKAAERRLHDSQTCTENEKEKYKNIPDDSELCIIDVINLDSGDEADDDICTKFKKEFVRQVKKETPNEKHNKLDVIFLD